MALRRILHDGDEALRKRSKEVTAFDDKLWVLLDDMKETMAHANGVDLLHRKWDFAPCCSN